MRLPVTKVELYVFAEFDDLPMAAQGHQPQSR